MDEETELWLAELLGPEAEEKMTEKQLKIWAAAVEIFSEKGFAATSTSEIAQKAGVAEGTIFRHYKTKKELLLSIVAPAMARLVAPFVLRDFAKVLDASYPRYEDFLRAVIRNRFEFAKEHIPILRIMVQEIPFHPELREPFIEHVGRKVAERFIRVYERFRDSGTVADIPVLPAIRMSASVVIGLFFTRFFVFPEAEWDDEAEIERCIDFIMHGLTPRSANG